jgi:hypothetical protein
MLPAIRLLATVVGDGEGVTVGDGVKVAVGVGVSVAVAVAVAVGTVVGVSVGTVVAVAVAVAVALGIGVAVLAATEIPSVKVPVVETFWPFTPPDGEVGSKAPTWMKYVWPALTEPEAGVLVDPQLPTWVRLPMPDPAKMPTTGLKSDDETVI